MDTGHIHIECSRTVKNILCEALLNYAYFSDEVKNNDNRDNIRQEILDLTHEIDYQFTIDRKSIKLPEAFFPYCERAIHYHYDRIFHLLDVNVDEQRKLMLDFLNGTATRDEQLDAALLRDNVI